MKVLIDTNVLLDALSGREPHFENADRILELRATKKVHGYMAAHSVPNMFYILRKDMTAEDRRNVLSKLCTILSVECIDLPKITAALDNGGFSDLEDCLQAECAESVSADYIITRNTKDFSLSKITAITPYDFLNLMNQAP